MKEKSFSKEDLALMVNKLVHRGPDADGFFLDTVAGLGHRRLSIRDLSPSANQPLYSSSGRYVITYNGEVFNVNELVQKYKIPLKTTSDTEAIIELFDKLGPDFVNELNGMFVMVIYDILKKEMYVFRDRLGVKPLYYFLDSEFFIFGSEIKALQALPFIRQKLKINSKIIPAFLHLGYIPEPDSIFTCIRKFPQGSFLKVTEKEQLWKSYYNLGQKVAAEVTSDFDEAKKNLTWLLEDAVSRRLTSDVPVGIFLSGGVDSSLVAAIAQRQVKNPIKTFTIGFKETAYNETSHAEEIARYIGTDHYSLMVSSKDFLECWEKVIDDFDEPFGDSSCFPTYILSRLAKAEVAVALSGEGSDELFMGYGSCNWAKRLHHPAARLLGNLVEFSLKHGNSRMKRASNMFNYSDPQKIKSHIFSQEQYLFSEKELPQILNSQYHSSVKLMQDFSDLQRGLSPREEQAFFDLTYYLKDDLLFKMDISSMLCSLEVRVPFLDYRIVEFALNLSENLKMKGNESKYLLKQILYSYIPKHYFQRPKKGFSIPLMEWMKNDLRFMLDEYLSQERIKQTGIFKYEYVQSLKNRFLSGKEDYLYNRLYLMIILQRWLIRNKYDIV